MTLNFFHSFGKIKLLGVSFSYNIGYSVVGYFMELYSRKYKLKIGLVPAVENEIYLLLLLLEFLSRSFSNAYKYF